MGDVINLNHVRKARAKADRTARADANRARFGRSKAQKDTDAADATRQAALLDAAKRED